MALNIPEGYNLDGTPKSLEYNPTSITDKKTDRTHYPRVDFDRHGNEIDWDRYVD